MHKGIPVEYCSGSSKYANLFGVSLSTAERLAYQRAGCVGRHGIAITHQSGRRFSVNQAAKLLLPVSCFSVACDNWGVGFDDADMALADAADSKMCLRNISSAELRLRPMPPCAGRKAVFTERTERKNTKESCGWPWGCSHPRTLVRPKLGI